MYNDFTVRMNDLSITISYNCFLHCLLYMLNFGCWLLLLLIYLMFIKRNYLGGYRIVLTTSR